MLVRLILGFAVCALVASDETEEPYFSVYQTRERIIADGFPAETHHVTTPDGYILEMHRIPHGRSGENVNEDRTAVLLMHGFTSDSNAYLALGPERSIGYNLADAGFDVWMGNARGTKNSRYHVSLNPDDEEQRFQFFDFSFEEIGMIDIPAMIDYILEYTGKERLHYIGHSQGGTVFLVMASMIPEINEKIISAHLLAGVGYQDYFPDQELIELAAMTDIIYGIALQMGIVELYPPNSTEMVPSDLLPGPSVTTRSDYCTGDLNTRHMCQLFGLRNIVREPGSPTDMPGAALKQVAHYGQNIRDRLFRRFHYGSAVNPTLYGTAEPPLYDLSLITTYVTMHYTLSDTLQDPRDVYAMVADMPRAIARQVARPTFLHEDFAIAPDVKELVTDYIIEALRNVEQEDINDGVVVVTEGSIDPEEIPAGEEVPIDPVDVPADPATDGATTINAVLNMYLIIFVLYTILI